MVDNTLSKKDNSKNKKKIHVEEFDNNNGGQYFIR